MALPPISADALLRAQITYCEGVRSMPYADTRGNVTIGIGWNLTANGLPDWAISALYDQAIADADAALDHVCPWWRSLDAVRGRVMQNLMFNMGPATLAKFPLFLAAMQAGRWGEASDQLGNSAWYGEVGRRGPLLTKMITSGLDPALPEAS